MTVQLSWEGCIWTRQAETVEKGAVLQAAWATAERQELKWHVERTSGCGPWPG